MESLDRISIERKTGAEPLHNNVERKRQADVYVFALLSHRDKATLDPLNVAQWEFYILPAAVLDIKVPQPRTPTEK